MKLSIRVLAFVFCWWISGHYLSAMSFYLYVDEIKGDGGDGGNYKNWINVDSFEALVETPLVESTGTTRPRGSAIFEDLAVTAEPSIASPDLWLSVAAGKVFKSVVLAGVERISEKNLSIFEWKLQDSRITRYDMYVDENSLLKEGLAFDYRTIQLTFFKYSADGIPLSKTSKSWDVEKEAQTDSTILIGDFDDDDDIDGLDFLAWQRGESSTPLSSEDLEIWQASYGVVGSTDSIRAVPEPGALLNLAVGLALIAGSLRRKL